MKVLLAVDIQKEFADKDGKYEEILSYINKSVQNNSYDKIIATKCRNNPDSNFVRYNNWHKLIDGVSELEFKADRIIEKVSYGLLDYSDIPKNALIDVIGYDTGACILKTALDLFDREYNFRILSRYCYSTGGLKHHNQGIAVLRNLMEKAVK